MITLWPHHLPLPLHLCPLFSLFEILFLLTVPAKVKCQPCLLLRGFWLTLPASSGCTFPSATPYAHLPAHCRDPVSSPVLPDLAITTQSCPASRVWAPWGRCPSYDLISLWDRIEQHTVSALKGVDPELQKKCDWGKERQMLLPALYLFSS